MEKKISTEYEERFNRSYYHKYATVWENYEKRRLYVPRNAYEDADYIDLDDRSLHETRPGNYSILKNVLEDLIACQIAQ